MVKKGPDITANPDDKYSLYCNETRKAILEIDARARGQKKREIVMLAEKLEKAGMPVNMICEEIVKRLHDVVHPTFVRRCLDAKYKDRRQSENAKKKAGQRNKQQIIDGNDLARQVSPHLNEKRVLLAIAIDNSGSPARDDHHSPSRHFAKRKAGPVMPAVPIAEDTAGISNNKEEETKMQPVDGSLTGLLCQSQD